MDGNDEDGHDAVRDDGAIMPDGNSGGGRDDDSFLSRGTYDDGGLLPIAAARTLRGYTAIIHKSLVSGAHT